MILSVGKDGVTAISTGSNDSYESIIISPKMNVISLCFNKTNYVPKDGEKIIMFNGIHIHFDNHDNAKKAFDRIDSLFSV